MSLNWLVIFVILTYSFIKTISYGTWTWKQKNVLGGFMLYLLATVCVLLPVYVLFFRR